MGKGQLIAGLILLALGIFVCHQAIHLSLGQASRPGPGFVPFGLGSILILLSILYILPPLRTIGRGGESQPSSGFHRTLLAVGVLCLFNVALNGLGYLISAFLLFILWLMLIERKKWPVSLGLACLALVFVYCFNLLFSVQLPKGILKGF